MKVKTIFLVSIFLVSISIVNAQEDNKWGFERKHFIGSQTFMILTPILNPSPKYYQLNYGYRPSAKDEISVEAITWTYQGPLGRPYGPNYEDSKSNFPGEIQAIGAGLAYKRFLWKGIYAQFHSTAFHQNYLDGAGNKIQSGFQLFNTLRVGYHFKIMKKRWFITPSLAVTNWPINTNLPESFKIEEDKWANYFLFEPGLQVGFTF